MKSSLKMICSLKISSNFPRSFFKTKFNTKTDEMAKNKVFWNIEEEYLLKI